MTEQTAPESFWGVVEVMGHSRHIGLAEEVTLAGAKMLRVSTPAVEADTPSESGRWQDASSAAVVLLSPAALFRVTPASQEQCLLLLRRDCPWVYPEIRRPALECVHQDPDHTGLCIRCGVDLDTIEWDDDSVG